MRTGDRSGTGKDSFFSHWPDHLGAASGRPGVFCAASSIGLGAEQAEEGVRWAES